jgi:hypothetical protein
VLKGEAKRKYMRDYMRRRRAEQRATPKPKREPTPTPTRAAAPEIAQKSSPEMVAQVAKLETQIEALKNKLADRQYYLDRALKAHARLEYALGRFRAGRGIASAKAFRSVDLCLHPDTRGQVTGKQIESAMVIWNSCREILVGKDAKATKPERAAPKAPARLRRD